MTEESVGKRSPVQTVAIVLMVISVVFGSVGTGTAAADERIVTQAEAFVDEDGDRDFDSTFEIHDLDSPVADPANMAVAHAKGCTGCRATALSFQIVLLQQPATVVGPENLAVSLNEGCTSCDTAAGAYQFVVGQGEPIRLTPTGYRELAKIRSEVVRLQASRLSGPATLAEADTLADRVQAVLDAEVQPVDEWVRVVIEDRRFRSFNDDPPQESSTMLTQAA